MGENIMEYMQTIRLDENDKCLSIGMSSVIGRRREQQDAIKADSIYSYIDTGRAIAVLCDGMGGLNSGGKASQLCSSFIFDAFHNAVDIPSIPGFFKSLIVETDEKVRTMQDENGNPLVGSGTTLASVIIDDNQLWWASVGDSHIYIIRNNEILCITTDHNFMMLLNEKVKRGEITREEADSNPKKEALISYIGMGGVRYVDLNTKRFYLMDGDFIVLCSDGLYRSLTEDEIKGVVYSFGKDTDNAAEALTSLAMSKELKNQDNTSVIVISYQELV